MNTKAKPAMTLIEILMAVTVFSLAILTTLATFNIALKVTKNSKEFTIATNLAQAEVEKYREMAFSEIVLAPDPTPVATDKLPEGYIETEITLYEGNDSLKLVSVKVYWQNRPESKAVTMTALIAQGGISG